MAKIEQLEPVTVTVTLVELYDKCPTCGTRILKEDQQDRPTRYFCPKCKHYLKKEFKLVEHLTPGEKALRAFMQENCNLYLKTAIKFEDGDLVEDLENLKEIVKLECDTCEEEFETEEELRQHIEGEHTGAEDEEEEGD